MSSLIVASNKIQQDVGGITGGANDASGPVREPIHVAVTDLGNIEHIIGGGGLVQNVQQRVSTALVKATDSIRGPNGGLIPSAIQHAPAAGVTRVDALYNAGVTETRSLTTRVRAQLVALGARLRG
jgi:hypothetical protein